MTILSSHIRSNFSFTIIITVLLLAISLASGLTGCGPIQPVATVEPTVVPSPTPPPAEVRRVVVLYSYEPDFWATPQEKRGIIDGLASMGYVEGQSVEITWLYMNTKTVNKTQEQMDAAAAKILPQIEEIDPDVLIILDDDALRHVGSKLLDTDLPVVFAGVNGFPNDPNYSPVGSLADSLDRPGHNITGVLERISFSAGFDLLHQILPEAKTALFISDNSSVTNLLMEGVGGEAELDQAAIKVVDKVYTDDYDVLKATILEYQDKVDAIVLFIPWTIVDKEGRHVPQQDVVAWMLRNNKRPGIAFLDVLAEEGYLCGVVVDMNQQGYHAAVMAGRILNGEKPSEMPIVDPVANRVMLNLARADQLGIDIPFEVLKSADVVFREMTAYPEYKMSGE